VSIDECPKSFITAQSTAWLSLFWAWKRFGFVLTGDLPARDIDALAICDEEWRKEQNHGGRRY
jgi:hypothetical protein